MAAPPCLYCATSTTFASPDEPPDLGSPVICGNCCGLHVLGIKADGQPKFFRPTRLERAELIARADVKAFLDAYQSDQIHSRLRRPKRKVKDLGVGGLKAGIRHGDQVRMTLRGDGSK